jgi:hypothetical protein
MILAAPTIPFILVPGIALALLRFVCSGCRLTRRHRVRSFNCDCMPSEGGLRLESEACRSLILSGGPSRL